MMTDALSNLFEAVQTALLNMETAMDLPSHPESCLCYGCGLKRAYMPAVLEHSRKNVKPIVDAEVEAEQRTRGLHL